MGINKNDNKKPKICVFGSGVLGKQIKKYLLKKILMLWLLALITLMIT